LLENPLFCSSVQQLGQFAAKDELLSEEVAIIHAEEVGIVDDEAEDEVASHCDESDSFQFQFPFVLACLLLPALLLVCEK
jgi:hypothetical protein